MDVEKGPKRQRCEWEEFDANMQETPVSQLSCKTACCCCVIGLHDCLPHIETELWLCCTEWKVGLACGCGQHKFGACVQDTCACHCLDKTSGEFKCCLLGTKGVRCCCCAGTVACQSNACKTCCQQKGQICCLDARVAFPTTDHVPCEVGCCGLMCHRAAEEGANLYNVRECEQHVAGNDVDFAGDRIRNRAQAPKGYQQCRVALLGPAISNTGKHFVQVRLVKGSYYYLGVAEEGVNLNNWLGSDNHGFAFYARDNLSRSAVSKRLGGPGTDFGPIMRTGDVATLCMDMNKGELSVAVNDGPQKVAFDYLQYKKLNFALGMGSNVTLQLLKSWSSSE